MTDLHLASPLSHDNQEPTRAGFGRGLVEVGRRDENVVGICADLRDSTKMDGFAKAYPERFFEAGITEQNIVTTGSGMAAIGKIPFVTSYAAFSPGRNWEQIRTTICLNNRPVKIVGSHAGLYTGLDGATHQVLEDIALMRVLPNMVVLVPCDSIEAEKMTLAMAVDDRPNYLRLARDPSPIVTTIETPFEIGPAYVFAEGSDISLIATGTMTYQALVAAELLKEKGIQAEVIHVPTIKPLDEKTILASIKKTGAAITVEEHQIAGGLGSAVAELIVENHLVPMRRIGMLDRYGESGEPEELLDKFGLTGKHIAKVASSLLGEIKQR